MTCPGCGGSGRIRKRFLFFFTRRARCGKCLGTGVFPPPARSPVAFRSDDRDDDDPWPSTRSAGSTGNVRQADAFEAGSGGRSGGGGASASWEAPSGSPPVIVDPFSGDSAVSTAAGAEAAESSSGVSSGGGSSDAGTSY